MWMNSNKKEEWFKGELRMVSVEKSNEYEET